MGEDREITVVEQVGDHMRVISANVASLEKNGVRAHRGDRPGCGAHLVFTLNAHAGKNRCLIRIRGDEIGQRNQPGPNCRDGVALDE